MKLTPVAILMFCTWACTGQATLPEKNHFATDEVEGRSLRIYLPPGYQNSGKRYPVVYLLDGQQWQIDDSLSKLIAGGKIEEIMVVGVYSSSQRTSEFLPY